MQTFKHVTRHIPLRPKVCLIWSSVSATTLRTFFACPAWNKSSEDHQVPKDSDLSTKSELKEDSKPSKDLELRKRREQQYKNAWTRNKYATNPIWREGALSKQSAYSRNRRATDQEWRNFKVEQSRKYYYLKMDTDSRFAIVAALRWWIYHQPSVREKLSWKAHIPLLTQEKIERHCASCGVKRRGGMRLFWQRQQESQTGEQLYDCNACFMKSTDTFLPEGFEHVKTLEQLHKRREELLGVKFRQRRRTTASSASSCPST